MPITKRGSLLLATVPSLHIAQNVLAKRQLSSPFLHSKLLDAFRQKAVSGDKLLAARSSVLPEIAIAERQFAAGGKRFQEALARHGMRSEDLSKRDLVIIRRALRGDFESALKAKSPRRNELVGALMAAVSDDVGRVAPHLLKKGKPAIKELEGVWKENPISGRLFKGMAKQMGKVQDTKPTTRADRFARGATTVGLTGAIAAVDPTTAAVNIGKRALGSPLAHKIGPLGKAQDAINTTMVTNPVRRSFDRGLSGERESYGGIGNLARDYLFNPVINQMRNLAQGVGRVAHGAGVTKEHLQGAKTVAEDIKSITA